MLNVQIVSAYIGGTRFTVIGPKTRTLINPVRIQARINFFLSSRASR